jgi:hypothetical protein
MSAPRRGIGIILTLSLFLPAFGQSPPTAPESRAACDAYRISPSRLLAGLRGYSDEVVEALVRLAQHPQVLEHVAQAIDADQQGELSVPDASPELRQAIETLRHAPELVMLAVTSPEQLERLRALWSVAPDGAAQRLRQLRAGYEQAAREAAWAWQRALEADPVALGEYRELLTGFCEAQREAVPGFACARVTDRRYYCACPPDEALLRYAAEVELPRSLGQVLARWSSEHAPDVIDAHLERTRVSPPAAVDARLSMHEWPPEQRAAMWASVEDAAGPQTLGLVPIILQPPADQPAAARLAWAVVEHARLWLPPMPAVALSDAEADAESDVEPPTIVVEEAIPGPQTVQHEGIVVYGDLSDQTPGEYVLPPYTGLSYGYSAIGPYYCGPTYYTYTGGAACSSYDVFRSTSRYRTGGVYLHLGRPECNWWVYYPSYHRRSYHDGSRHTGRPSVSVGPRSRRAPAHGYQAPSPWTQARNRSRYYGYPGSRVGRSSAGTRAIRSGTRSIHAGSRPTIRSGSRPATRSNLRSAVRSGIRTGVRNGLRDVIHNRIQSGHSRAGSTRSGTRAVRPSSRSGGRSGGARRR